MAGRDGGRGAAPPADARGSCTRAPTSNPAPVESVPPANAKGSHAPSSLAQEHGIAASDLKKLLEAGIHTVEGLAHAPKKQLKDIKGLSEMKVEKLKAAGAIFNLATLRHEESPRKPNLDSTLTT